MVTLRPSTAATWMVCFGYAAMRAAYPEAPEEADNDVREDGTACHWLAEQEWNGKSVAIGSLSPNQRVITQEMFNAVADYFVVLRSWRGKALLEHPVPLDVIYPGMAGTVDAHALSHEHRTLDVGDLKYGFRFVEVIENWQLICYALGLIMEHRLPADYKVTLHIIQPRSFHRAGPRRRWTTTVGELVATYLPQLQRAAREAMGPAPLCTPNPGCVDCPGRHACEALQNAAHTSLEVAYSATPHNLPSAALGNELARLKVAAKHLEARITGLETDVEARLRKGQVVIGWALAPSFAREAWKEGAQSQLLTLASQYYGVDLAKPRELVTPAEARRRFPATLVAQFTHKPSTGVKLVKTDKNEARRIFDPSAGEAT